MHVRTISSCVTSQKVDDDTVAAHARDARVEVLILTHRALFFPYRARVHRLFTRFPSSSPEPDSSRQGGDSSIRKSSDFEKKRNTQMPIYACVRSSFRSFARFSTCNLRATWHACRDANYGRGLHSALLLAGRVCAWMHECVDACTQMCAQHASRTRCA